MGEKIGIVRKKGKERLDALMLNRGLVQSRTRGQTLIMAGEVQVNGEKAVKPSMLVPIDAQIEIISPLPYVSRGGIKLAGALDTFAIEVRDKICADVGACTGGFTDVLLQREAGRIYAIDVGYGQLHWKLRQDRRVIILERTNARHLESLPEPVNFVSVDVSFISLRLVLPSVKGWLDEEADIVALIKPQFEAGPENVGKGGIVRDPTIHRQVLAEILNWSIDNELTPIGLIRSPISGSDGNVEFFVWLQMGQEMNLNLSETIQEVTG
jgi:23S rRNA (cytidine1920-2'-O)/16S rRNA (cytidine1409-2'-O)-methyltransferase